MAVTLKDEFKYLVGGYYGVMEMDEYDLKVYVLKDIENYIRDFIKENPISNLFLFSCLLCLSNS